MITGRTPATTIEELRATLQRAVSCVMPAVLAVEPRAIETRFFTSGSVAGDKNLYQVPMNIPGLP